MDEPYSHGLYKILRKTETFRAILASSVRGLDTKCSSTGGTPEDRAETLPSKQLRDEIDDIMMPYFLEEYPEYASEMLRQKTKTVRENSIMDTPSVPETIINEAARTPFRPVNVTQATSSGNSHGQGQTSSPRVSTPRSRIPRPSISRLSISSISSIPRPSTPQSSTSRPSTPRANTTPPPSTPQSNTFRPRTPRASISQASTPRSTTSRASIRSTTSRASFRSSTSTASFRSSVSRPVTPRAVTSPDPRVATASFASPTLSSILKSKKSGSLASTPMTTPTRSSTPSSSRAQPATTTVAGNTTPLSPKEYPEYRSNARDTDEEREYANGFLSSLAGNLNAAVDENGSPNQRQAGTPLQGAKTTKVAKVTRGTVATSSTHSVLKKKSRSSLETPRKTA